MQYQIIGNSDLNINNIVFVFGNIKILGRQGQNLNENEKIRVGYHIKGTFNHNMNVVFCFENYKICGCRNLKCGSKVSLNCKTPVGCQIKGT